MFFSNRLITVKTPKLQSPWIKKKIKTHVPSFTPRPTKRKRRNSWQKKGEKKGDVRDTFAWRQNEHNFVRRYPGFGLLSF